ncbi:hypothetical protein BZM27_53795 [Paraburkholderia steynii]|uniref:Uncharacterized protein n=1 Tax=Paraburkholderia steynii TaxID=1245441 RepID=A0A4R0WYE9_9BURK|nr:hypothetical protein BZM27_53795 [Paraburkholderia steynii]
MPQNQLSHESDSVYDTQGHVGMLEHMLKYIIDNTLSFWQILAVLVNSVPSHRARRVDARLHHLTGRLSSRILGTPFAR